MRHYSINVAAQYNCWVWVFLQRDHGLGIIKYGKCKIPAKLMGNTFLDWTNESVKPHFWNRLGDFLGKPGNFRSSLDSAEEKPKKTSETVTSSSYAPLSRMTSEYDSDFLDMESLDDVFLPTGQRGDNRERRS